MRLILFLSLIVAFSVFANAQMNTGDLAQNFVETTITGENLELDQMRGKVVVLTFWSTRCEICAAEIPRLNKLVDKYSGRGVVFVGLAWQDKAKLEAYFAKKPFKFKIVPQSLGVLLKYADRDAQGRLNMGFPSHFVISPEGYVVLKDSGWDKTGELDSTISNLLAGSVAKLD